MTDPIATLEALHAAATADYGDDVFRRLRHVHAYQGAVLDAMPAILRALKAAEFARDRLRAVASIFNDPRFTDRYEDGPACALVADELDAALAALTPTENPK
jgi:hypothetical protein